MSPNYGPICGFKMTTRLPALLQDDEGIGATLGPDLRGRPVPGKHRDVIAEREYFFSDPGYQQVEISAG